MRVVVLAMSAALAFAGAVQAGPTDEARAALRGQMDAWNAGDLESALGSYRPGPEMIWVSQTGMDLGLDAFAEDLRRRFGSDPSGMGVYSGEVLHAEALGPDAVILIVRWRIENDGRRLFGGVSTQIWRPIDGRWRIVVEHAS